MDTINKLILQLASLQCALLTNANAYDDDLEDTWLQLKDDYESLKTSMDKYIDNMDK
jgi:hypothetical protein